MREHCEWSKQFRQTVIHVEAVWNYKNGYRQLHSTDQTPFLMEYMSGTNKHCMRRQFKTLLLVFMLVGGLFRVTSLNTVMNKL